MDLEAAEVDVALVALGTLVRPLPGVQSLVQLQVHKLGELGRAHLALVRLLSGVESQVGLEIAGAAKSLVADLQSGDKGGRGRETGKNRRLRVASGRDKLTGQRPATQS